MPVPKKKLIAIDLFSGCGGLTAGLKEAGYKVVAAVELDEKARQTYALNHPTTRLAGRDIRDVDADDLMSSLGLLPGELDLLAGCPPCQGFSRMRKRNKNSSAKDDRNGLIDDFLRFVLTFLPKRVMMENVPGLLDYYKFKKFKSALRQVGYDVLTEVLDVSDFGVPQRRKRLIVSCSAQGKAVLALPERSRTTVRETIADLPVAGASGDALHDIGERRSPKVRELIELIPLDGGSRKDLPPHLQLECHKKSDGFNDVYGRMSWDDISPTITGGCFNPSKGRFLHPAFHRTITLREAALLQGFPRNYKFDVRHGKEAIALMIGNALPPRFIAAHARAIANSIIR
ncbi:DNA cytosine methyltransferase [Pseudoduganella sp. HUAS MS19]